MVADALMSAWFIRSVIVATINLAIMGIPWAIVLWVPFSIVGDFVSIEEEKWQHQQLENGNGSAIPKANQEEDFDAGMVSGVQNMYIVFRQFAVVIIASVIFTVGYGDQTSGLASVLVFGGIISSVAAAFSSFVVRAT